MKLIQLLKAITILSSTSLCLYQEQKEERAIGLNNALVRVVSCDSTRSIKAAFSTYFALILCFPLPNIKKKGGGGGGSFPSARKDNYKHLQSIYILKVSLTSHSPIQLNSKLPKGHK